MTMKTDRNENEEDEHGQNVETGLLTRRGRTSLGFLRYVSYSSSLDVPQTSLQ